MRPGGAAGRQHRIGVGRETHPRDVLGDGPVEEFDVLRDIADMPAERVLVPLVERGTVEPDLAARGRPDTDQASDQRGLTGAARSDNGDCFSRVESEMDIGDDRGVAAWAQPPRRARRRSLRVGVGRSVRVWRAGDFRSVAESRSNDWRAAVSERQLAITTSIGASARPIMIDAANMAPALSSCWMTR